MFDDHEMPHQDITSSRRLQPNVFPNGWHHRKRTGKRIRRKQLLWIEKYTTGGYQIRPKGISFEKHEELVFYILKFGSR